MSRPHTMGGRDPWHFVPDNKRVPPQPEPWLAELNKTYTPQCGACHPPLDGEGRHNRWLNLTRPESSRLLNAHLARPAGGMELAGKDHNPPVRIFPDRSDPVYHALWQALEKGKAALLVRPRMDMPGAVPIPQERNFGKVY